VAEPRAGSIAVDPAGERLVFVPTGTVLVGMGTLLC
jgi:hypothetical protein